MWASGQVRKGKRSAGARGRQQGACHRVHVWPVTLVALVLPADPPLPPPRAPTPHACGGIVPLHTRTPLLTYIVHLCLRLPADNATVPWYSETEFPTWWSAIQPLLNSVASARPATEAHTPTSRTTSRSSCSRELGSARSRLCRYSLLRSASGCCGEASGGGAVETESAGAGPPGTPLGGDGGSPLGAAYATCRAGRQYIVFKIAYFLFWVCQQRHAARDSRSVLCMACSV